MRVHLVFLLMASQSSSASIEKTTIFVNASPVIGASRRIARLGILEVAHGNSSERVPLILDSEGSRSELVIPVTLESVQEEMNGHEDDESYFPSAYDETSVTFRIRNSWVGEPDIELEDTNVLTQKYLPMEEEGDDESPRLETYGTLAIGPSSSFANQFKSFVIVPSVLGTGVDERIVKQLVISPINAGCDCAGPDYRMKAATAIRVPGIGYTTSDTWAVMGSSRLVDDTRTTSLRLSAAASQEARYRISTASNVDYIPANVYDALVANITAQGASVSQSETDDLLKLTIISNCEKVKNWPKIAYSIALASGQGSGSNNVFDIVIDESDYTEPMTPFFEDHESESGLCILHLEPLRQIYSKPIEEYTLGVNMLNKIAIHFDNVNRQVGFCYSARIRRSV